MVTVARIGTGVLPTIDHSYDRWYRRLEGKPLLIIFGSRTHALENIRKSRHVDVSRLSIASMSLVILRMRRVPSNRQSCPLNRLIRFSALDGWRKFVIWRAGRYITLEMCDDCAFSPKYVLCFATVVLRYAG